MKTKQQENKFFDEYILCPKCHSSEKTKVLHTGNIWIFFHKCLQCGNVISQGNVKRLSVNKLPVKEFQSML
ncbi:MAG: hypothetical protein A2275_04655 [Bacteroidetes bacterium RIFOXYA12_FULL_35_11]|nr:MAG: hypothetical protein A2X01_11175 [Bacteroidetes bacterium GWF2_35_48]OFY75458.1 MAG: hypothetical protein A2275_04655 [Bacteroidetes bacterium RIFOXYA12_FULL_35_11]OFY96115.1 MAG: hypothetical protein A2491_05865 [Bacteroidetes bacterium RIFOXYC12_FULL_35_7]OFY97469.1 MAG: hypothetical protein A2309_06255 [Bacteroidetes bacterium RIFOXYB2_FULL_35_7]HBX51324.1 hypothetical protein [Bacteroidales bacterium]